MFFTFQIQFSRVLMTTKQRPGAAVEGVDHLNSVFLEKGWKK